jgi:hypothetical protein
LSEAFSTGLTILSAGNLADYEVLYNLQTHEIEAGKLSEGLKTWALNSAYSVVLRGTVLLLLNVHPEKRLSCSELSELLAKHAEPILKNENFVIDNAPGKLHEEIQHLLATLAQVAPPNHQPILIIPEQPSEIKIEKKILEKP